MNRHKLPPIQQFPSKKRNGKNLLGQEFGKLKVIEHAGSDKSGAWIWLCQCSCGKQTVVRGYSLRRGDTTSCGCYLYSFERIKRKPSRFATQEEASWFARYTQYKFHADRRSIDFRISLEEFIEICSKPCFYCGMKPELRPKCRATAQISASGVDRFDNAVGYEISNCVPCCSWCNKTKHSITAAQFIENCMRVAKHAFTSRIIGA